MNYKNFIRELDFTSLARAFKEAVPFNHIVIDDFLKIEIAKKIADEFPSFEDPCWRVYNNALEVKKLVNHYDCFGKTTYQLFSAINDRSFVTELEKIICEPLFPDIGLNGGGLHTHGRGGKLNPHLDYSIHPKLGLERRLNLIIYLTPGWKSEWGGSLGMWAQNENGSGPGELKKKVDSLFNRAVLFDTSQNSWHGLPEPLTCPADQYRNSIAAYYLCNPRENISNRGKALFAPYGDQVNQSEVLELIKKRSSVENAASVYGDKKKDR